MAKKLDKKYILDRLDKDFSEEDLKCLLISAAAYLADAECFDEKCGDMGWTDSQMFDFVSELGGLVERIRPRA